MLLTLVFTGILAAFWLLKDMTGHETVVSPFSSAETSLRYTADLKWYFSLNADQIYFAIPVSMGIIIAVLLFAYRRSSKALEQNERYEVLFCIILVALTILFSFGARLPLIKDLPVAQSLYSGRILVLTSALGAILCAYVILGILKLAKGKKTKCPDLYDSLLHVDHCVLPVLYESAAYKV